MLLPRKLIILAIIIHVVTIIACASLQPDEESTPDEPAIEQQDLIKQTTEDQVEEETSILDQ